MSLKRYFQKNAKVLTLALVLGAGIPLLMNPSGLKTSVLDYENIYKEGDLESTIIAFHVNMNDITNEYLERMHALVGQGAEPNVSFPLDPKEGCTPDNVSTYCLAKALNTELLAFESTLMLHRQDFKLDENLSFSNLNLTQALDESTGRQALIDNEITAAESALDLNLAVYDQIQNVYPLHVELVELINQLEAYRDNLAGIRDEVELFPSRFNNVTTTYCL